MSAGASVFVQSGLHKYFPPFLFVCGSVDLSCRQHMSTQVCASVCPPVCKSVSVRLKYWFVNVSTGCSTLFRFLFFPWVCLLVWMSVSVLVIVCLYNLSSSFFSFWCFCDLNVILYQCVLLLLFTSTCLCLSSRLRSCSNCRPVRIGLSCQCLLFLLVRLCLSSCVPNYVLWLSRRSVCIRLSGQCVLFQFVSLCWSSFFTL